MIAVTVNLDTTALTRALVRSIRKWCGPEVRIVVMDNSVREAFVAEEGYEVEVLRNGAGELVDFDAELAKWEDKDETEAWNGWGSARHMMSIDWLVRNLDLRGEKGFLLMDSDVLLRKSVADLADGRMAWVGQIRRYKGRDGKEYERLWPFLCWIGAEQCRRAGVRYFNGEYCYALTKGEGRHWDTGAWFLGECRRLGLPGREVNIGEYIVHLGQSSYKDHGVLTEWWLEKWSALWR